VLAGAAVLGLGPPVTGTPLGPKGPKPPLAPGVLWPMPAPCPVLHAKGSLKPVVRKRGDGQETEGEGAVGGGVRAVWVELTSLAAGAQPLKNLQETALLVHQFVGPLQEVRSRLGPVAERTGYTPRQK
jgi:hypothetical protein